MARFLADESCDFAVVRALRSAGHDVAAIVESAPGTPDENVIDLAVREVRILITEDTDFGQLVYAHAHPSGGVILLRFPAGVRGDLGPQVVRFVDRYGGSLIGSFVVLQPGRFESAGRSNHCWSKWTQQVVFYVGKSSQTSSSSEIAWSRRTEGKSSRNVAKVSPAAK